MDHLTTMVSPQDLGWSSRPRTQMAVSLAAINWGDPIITYGRPGMILQVGDPNRDIRWALANPKSICLGTLRGLHISCNEKRHWKHQKIIKKWIRKKTLMRFSKSDLIEAPWIVHLWCCLEVQWTKKKSSKKEWWYLCTPGVFFCEFSLARFQSISWLLPVQTGSQWEIVKVNMEYRCLFHLVPRDFLPTPNPSIYFSHQKGSLVALFENANISYSKGRKGPWSISNQLLGTFKIWGIS